MHPIAPRPTILAALLLIAHQSALLRLALQGAAQSQSEPVRAVHWHAGASGAAALTLARPAARGTLGRIQLPFLLIRHDLFWISPPFALRYRRGLRYLSPNGDGE